MCRSLGAKNLEFKAERLHYRAQQRSSLTIAGEPADPLFFFWKACKCSMACKCFFETREASVCSESSARLIKLSECRGDINDHLQACHLGQLRGTVQEYELIVNRSGLPHDLGWKLRPRRACQYPLGNGRKKQLNTRNAVHLDMSREINSIFVELVPTGSRELI